MNKNGNSCQKKLKGLRITSTQSKRAHGNLIGTF